MSDPEVIADVLKGERPICYHCGKEFLSIKHFFMRSEGSTDRVPTTEHVRWDFNLKDWIIEEDTLYHGDHCGTMTFTGSCGCDHGDYPQMTFTYEDLEYDWRHPNYHG